MTDPGPEVSPLVGGPLYRLYLRLHLARPPLELVGRRMTALVLVTWLPLLVLSLFGTFGGLAFLADFEVHARFLVALPLLVLAEVTVDQRMRKAIQQFSERGLLPPSERAKFDTAAFALVRWTHSTVVELALLVFVLTAGHLLWRHNFALDQTTWYLAPDYTPAGYWYAFVGVPVFQFLLLRWYARLFFWFQFLWRVSRLELRLDAAHPDRAGGIGFVGRFSNSFSIILFAQGALLSGQIADQIFHNGRSLVSFKVDIAAAVLALLLLFLGPLTVFTPTLVRSRREGLREYGGLASRYLQEFHRKWLEGGAAPAETLLGSADIQSLADMGNSYAPVREMRWVPFGWDTAARLALAVVAPVLPLVLTVVPLEQLIDRLIKSLF